MPLAYSDCVWCVEKYQDHLMRGGHCHDGKHVFVLEGEMRLRDLPIGTSVLYYTDGGGNIIDLYSPPHPVWCGKGVLRAIQNPLFPNSRSVLLVWRNFDTIPLGAGDVHHTVPEYVKLMQPQDAYGLWINEGTPVKKAYIPNGVSFTGTPIVAQQAPSKPQGMQCARVDCRAFNEYAEPNQPDNTYICFQCRQRGY